MTTSIRRTPVICFYIFFFFVIFSPVHQASPSDYENNTKDLFAILDKAMLSAEKALNYFKRHVTYVNLDGVMGCRFVEAEVGNLLTLHWESLPISVLKRMRNLQKLASSVSELSTISVQEKTPNYFSLMHPLIRPHFWDLSLRYRPLSQIPELQLQFNASMTEAESDRCLSEVLGTKGHHPCDPSADCWKKMISANFSGFDLTHQTFYILVLLESNCFETITESMKKWSPNESLWSILDKICAKVFYQATTTANEGFPPVKHDLFMEQIGMCSKVGYLDFADFSWLSPIVSWQRESGCYGYSEAEILRLQRLPYLPRLFAYGHSRRKRVENIMSTDGCLSHRTSVALFALSSFMRRSLHLLYRQ